MTEAMITFLADQILSLPALWVQWASQDMAPTSLSQSEVEQTKVFSLINSATKNNPFNALVDLEVSYQTDEDNNSILHGHYILAVRDLSVGSTVNTGLLFQLEGMKEWDGFDISFDFDDMETAPEFRSADLYVTDSTPDVLQRGITPQALPRD